MTRNAIEAKSELIKNQSNYNNRTVTMMMRMIIIWRAESNNKQQQTTNQSTTQQHIYTQTHKQNQYFVVYKIKIYFLILLTN